MAWRARAGAGTVEDAHASGVELHGVVDEICDSLDGVGYAEAAHVYLAAETELTLAALVGGGGADE